MHGLRHNSEFGISAKALGGGCGEPVYHWKPANCYSVTRVGISLLTTRRQRSRNWWPQQRKSRTGASLDLGFGDQTRAALRPLPCWIDHNSLRAVVTPAGRLRFAAASKLLLWSQFFERWSAPDGPHKLRRYPVLIPSTAGYDSGCSARNSNRSKKAL
jgi:hypothetical protein